MTQGVVRTGSAVAVLAATADLATATQVASGLEALGVSADVNPPQVAERAVVVVSVNAGLDVAWREAVRVHERARLVPIRVGTVDADGLPAAVTEPNWIAWSASAAPMRLSEVFAALHSDMSRYRTHRSLAVSAAEWHGAGRPGHLLITEYEAVEHAVRHLADAAHDPLATPTPLIREYVGCSRRDASGIRRRRNRRWWLRGLATVIAVAIAVTVFVLIRTAAGVTNLQFQATTVPWLTQSRPDRTAMLSAALVLQADADHKTQPRRTTYAALGQPWSLGLVGANHPATIQLAVLDRDGRRTLGLDANGLLALWDNESLNLTWQHAVDGSASPVDFDGDPDLTRIVLGTGQGLQLITREPWAQRAIPLPEPPSAVAIAGGEQLAAVATRRGDLFTVGFATGTPGPALHFDRVFDLRQTDDGGVRALVRSGNDLLVVDPVTGTRSRPLSYPDHRFAQAVLAPDGLGVATVGPDRQLYYSAGDGPLRPTGQALANPNSVLTVLPGGRIVYGGPEFGVHVFDVRAGVTVGEVCRTETPVMAVRAAADGDMLACLDSFIVDLWRSRDFGPMPTEPEAAHDASRTPSMVDNGLNATGGHDGRLEVTWQGAHWRIPVSAAPVTAVSVNAATRSVVAGAADGTVVQIVVSSSTASEVVRWSVPDGSPVTAVGTESPRRLLVGTGRGLWWSPTSCDGCDQDDVLVERVRERLWGCYTENQFEFLDDDSRERLGIQACQPEPAE